MPAQVRGKVPVMEFPHCPGVYGRDPLTWPAPVPSDAGGRHVADIAAWADHRIEAGESPEDWPGRLHDVAIIWRGEAARAERWVVKQAKQAAGSGNALAEARRRAGAGRR